MSVIIIINMSVNSNVKLTCFLHILVVRPDVHLSIHSDKVGGVGSIRLGTRDGSPACRDTGCLAPPCTSPSQPRNALPLRKVQNWRHLWGKCDLGLVEPPSSHPDLHALPPVPSNFSLALPALPVRKKAAPLIPAWNPPPLLF